MSTSNDQSEEKIFGQDGRQFMQIVRVLINGFEKDRINYVFIDQSQYESLIMKDWKAAAKVYWEETLGRIHFAAAASIIRAYRWSSGMSTSYSNDLFLPFCASFRALIESAADGYDALNNVATSLAENRNRVNQTLRQEAKQFVVAEELENQLIHFSHARKLPKGTEAPPTHNAKQVAEYIRALEESGLKGLYACYSDLCQYTHPAAHSVANLLIPTQTSSLLLVPNHDQYRIEAFLEQYRELLVPLLMAAFTPGVLALKVLLHFDASQFHCREVRNVGLNEIKAWKRCAAAMGVMP